MPVTRGTRPSPLNVGLKAIHTRDCPRSVTASISYKHRTGEFKRSPPRQVPPGLCCSRLQQTSLYKRSDVTDWFVLCKYRLHGSYQVHSRWGNIWWQGVSRANCGPDSIIAAEDNLVELGLDYVDLLLVHFPRIGGCWRAQLQRH